jgi:hypothetical protein
MGKIPVEKPIDTIRCARCVLHPLVAGWSSLVARQAHNLKVVGSNPTPAPNLISINPLNPRRLRVFALKRSPSPKKQGLSPKKTRRDAKGAKVRNVARLPTVPGRFPARFPPFPIG